MRKENKEKLSLQSSILILGLSMISQLHISHISHDAVTITVTQSYVIERYKRF